MIYSKASIESDTEISEYTVVCKWSVEKESKAMAPEEKDQEIQNKGDELDDELDDELVDELDAVLRLYRVFG